MATDAEARDSVSPLNGLRVLDLTQDIAGAYATKLMAGFGAQVLLVEDPQHGHPLRHREPFVRGQAGMDRAIPFLWLATGKKSVAVALDCSEGQTILGRLIASCHVVVCQGEPFHSMFDWEKVCRCHPHLIVIRITPFGMRGPYASFEASEVQIQALAGMMHLTGREERSPLRAGPSVCQYVTGLHAYVGALMALWRKRQTGRGACVDLSTHECALELVELAITSASLTGQSPRRGGHPFVPWDLYPCRDGFAFVIGAPFRNWKRICQVLDEPRLCEPPLDDARQRVKHKEQVDGLIQAKVKNMCKEDLFHAGQKAGLAFGYLRNLEEVLDCPQHIARHFFQSLHHPSVGTFQYCNAPFHLPQSPWRLSRAPLLGEDTEAVLRDSEGDPGDPFEKRSESAFSFQAEKHVDSWARKLPLDGILIVDLTHSWAGPHATRLLADYGAQVIRVEFPGRLCLLRGAHKQGGAYNKVPGWLQVNRNKHCITLDLRKTRDKNLLLRLVAMADAVVENGRVGVMARLGLDVERLYSLKKDLILLSMPAFGTTGPWAGHMGYGATVEALSGILSLTAYEEGSLPCRVKELDIINGVAAASALLTALLHRGRTGMGQHIDFSHMEAATHVLVGGELLEYAANGSLTRTPGNRHPIHAPQGCYPCAGSDEWVTITVRSDPEWEALCLAMGRPDWSKDSRFSTQEARWSHHDLLDQMIADWTQNLRHVDVMQALQAHGIAAAAVLSPLDVVNDPHLNQRGYFGTAPGRSSVRLMGFPIEIDGVRPSLNWPGPALGAHNKEILCDWLGEGPEAASVPQENEIRTAYDA